jgi:sterol desaturase/sphingolipid hydroxylase (fatty acid hydroxylase superfamily)
METLEQNIPLTTKIIYLFLVIFFRYLVIALVAFVIFYLLRKEEWGFKKIQSAIPANKDYYREIGFSFFTAVIFTSVGWLIFLSPVRQFTKVYTDIKSLGMFYFFISVAIMLVLHDAYFYWTHRAMHHPQLFKLFHKVHHLSTNPSPWAAFAFHPLEAIVEAGILIIVPFIIPVHPFAIALFLISMMVYNVYGHLGFELYPKGFSKSSIGKWINTSVNHNQHHAHFKGNYGLYFLWWDRWMGTLRKDYDQEFDRVVD